MSSRSLLFKFPRAESFQHIESVDEQIIKWVKNRLIELLSKHINFNESDGKSKTDWYNKTTNTFSESTAIDYLIKTSDYSKVESEINILSYIKFSMKAVFGQSKNKNQIPSSQPVLRSYSDKSLASARSRLTLVISSFIETLAYYYDFVSISTLIFAMILFERYLNSYEEQFRSTTQAKR